MFSSYSEESHIYDKYLGLLPFFDFDGVWILSYMNSAHWALSIQAQVIAIAWGENMHQSGGTFGPQ